MNLRKRTEYILLLVLLIIGYGFLAAYAVSRVDDWRVARSTQYLYEAKIASNDSGKLLLYEKAALLNPNEETYLRAGVASLKLGDNKLAGKYLNRVKTAEGYYQLGNAYYNLERYELAANYYQKSLSKEQNAIVNYDLARCYLKLGNIDSARAALAESAKLLPTEESATLSELLGTDNSDLDPGNRSVINYNTLLSLGYPQSAQRVLDMAVAEGKVTRDSLITLAIQQKIGGNNQRAYDYLMAARTIDPYYPQIYQQLVIVCEKLGKDDELQKYQEFLGNITF